MDDLSQCSSNNIRFSDQEAQIVKDVTEILEDLYDNNEFTEFNLHFLIKPNFNKNVKYDIVKLNEHLSQYPSHFLNENITRVYKNTGLINSTSILVFFSLYDINNLNQISKDIFKDIKSNINVINNNLDINQGNTITNFLNNVEGNKELFLFINANYNTLDEHYKNK